MPLGDSVLNFGRTLQDARERRRDAGLRSSIVAADVDMRRIYGRMRLRGEFDPDTLIAEYDTRMQNIRAQFGERRSEDAYFTTVRSKFSETLENEIYRRAIRDENAAVVELSLGVARAHQEEIGRNPNIPLEEMDNLASEAAELIVSQIDPTTGDEARSRVYDQMLAYNRSVIRVQDEQRAETDRLLFTSGIAADIDGINRRLLGGEIDHTTAIRDAVALERQIARLPLSASTSKTLDTVRDFTNQIIGQRTDAGKAERSLALRASVEKSVDSIQQRVADGTISAQDGIAESEEIVGLLEALPLTDQRVNSLDEVNNLITQLKRTPKKKDLSFERARAPVDRFVIDMENNQYGSEDDLLADITKAAEMVKALPEGTSEQIRFKNEIYKRISKVTSNYAADVQDRVSDVNITGFTVVRNNLESAIRDGSIASTEQLEESLSQMDILFGGDDATEEMKQGLSNARVSLKTLHENIYRQNTIQPLIDLIKAEIGQQPQITAAGVINHMNTRADELAEERTMTPEQRLSFKRSLFAALAPDLSQAASISYEQAYVQAKQEIEHILERANNSIETDGGIDVESVTTQIDELMNSLDDDIQHDLQVNVVNDGINKLSSAITDKNKASIREQNRQLIEESIINAGQDLWDNPESYGELFQEILSDIDASDLSPEVKTDLIKEARNTLAEQQIHGKVRDYLDEEDNRDNLDSFVAQLKGNAMYTGMDVQGISQAAADQWREEFRQQSKAIVDERLLPENLPNQTDADLASIQTDSRITLEDKVRYTNGFNEHNERRLAARDFQTSVNDPARVITQEDADGYNAWWDREGGAGTFLNTPQLLVGAINKAGFMTPEIVKSIWSTVLSGSPEEAQKMLSSLSALTPEVLNASLEREQHEQFVVWKYDRRATTPEESITMLRSMFDGAREQLRQGLEREYTRLALEREYHRTDKIYRILDVDDAPEDSYGLRIAYEEYIQTQRELFLGGLAWGDAEDAAAELIKREWGKNINGRAMFLPPSSIGAPKLFDIKTRKYNYDWINDDVQSLAKGLVPEGTEVILFADDESKRLKNVNQPVSYLLRYRDESGNIEFVQDEEGRTPRYLPVPPEEVVKEQPTKIREAQDRRTHPLRR